MTQWRDERPAGSGSIEELGSVARPALVGSSRSAVIPALIVGGLLAGVVALGISGRPPGPRDAEPPPAAAADTSPASLAPAQSPDATDPSATPGPTPSRPRPSQPPPPNNPLLQDDVLFWVELVDDEGTLVRGYLAPGEEHRVSMTITGARSENVRLRLFGRIGDQEPFRLANVAVPATSGPLERPLVLDNRTLTADDWPDGYSTDGLTDLEYRLRLEGGLAGSRQVVVRVSIARGGLITR